MPEIEQLGITEDLHVYVEDVTPQPKILPPIGVMGPIGHGKTTLARILSGYGGYGIFPFAQPLKDMMRAIGLSEDDVNGEHKEIPHPILCGKTPRHAMQTIGTEWGRQMIGSDIWLNAWRFRVEGSPVRRAIADDCRFLNEARLIRQLGGEIWRVIDPRKEIPEIVHLSEKEWMLVEPDVVIINDGTVEDMTHRVAAIMSSKRKD